MERKHATDTELEKLHLGMVKGKQLRLLEDHIIGCARCAMRAEEAAEYVDAMRAGAIMGNFDVDG